MGSKNGKEKAKGLLTTANQTALAGIKEIYNLDNIKLTISSLDTEFDDFAKNIEDTKTLLKNAFAVTEAIYGPGAAKMQQAMMVNLGAAKDFIDNFKNWLAYVELQAEDIVKSNNETEAQFKMVELKAANKAAQYRIVDEDEKKKVREHE
jgi:hypothetical protein